MELHTLSFLVFVCVVVLIYWRLQAKFRWVVLLFASLFFYFSWRPAYGVLVFASVLLTYSAGLGIERWPKRKNLVLVGTVLLHVSALFLFKYAAFFTLTVSDLFKYFGTSLSLPVVKMFLPLGISFYTFQAISYLIDVSRKKITAEKHLGYFTIFMLFFPKFLAGPIERAEHFLPQLHGKKKTITTPQITTGLQLIAVGLFKKLVVADSIHLIVQRVFNNLPEYAGLSLVITLVLYSLQIYADFSGYTDIARGAARLLGIELLENFRFPYFATSLRDFWQRWHISLSSWLRDYIYIPLGGNRRGLIIGCMNTLIVFFICGLWHGASWGFIIWGVVHGVGLVIERTLRHFNKGKLQLPKILGWAYTYGVVLMSWSFFATTKLSDALYILRNAPVGIKNTFRPEYLSATLNRVFNMNPLEMYITLFCVAALLIIDIVRSRSKFRELFFRQPLIIRLVVYCVFVALIITLRQVDVKEFVYVQF
jgi:alginate O-acetyltransferase complex protein AlgI